jgi:hypothetical protein
MGLSLSTKMRSPSEPESDRIRTNFLFVVLVTALAVVFMFRSNLHHSYYGCALALRWVFLGRILFSLMYSHLFA